MTIPSGNEERSVLYVVDTPIGNLDDLTRRAIDVFRSVPLVIAEDTRRTNQLLSHLDLRTEVVSFHQHSNENRTSELIHRIQEERSAALVSDAGNPTISDPGWRLVAEAEEEDLRVIPIPGPSAVSAALSVSGLNADRYVFAGYPPEDDKKRTEWFRTARSADGPMVCFVAPHDVEDVLQFFRDQSDYVQIIATRELTKQHEERVRGSAGDLLNQFDDREIKGEWTLVLDVEPEDSSVEEKEKSEIREEDLLFLLDQDVPPSSAARILSRLKNVDRGTAYDLLEKKKEERQ